MARRTRDWNKGLALNLRNREFAREFLLAAIEEGISLQHALGKVVRAMGVKEFAARVRMESPNLLRAISPSHNPTQATTNRLLKPFGLRLSPAPIKKPKRSNATGRSASKSPGSTEFKGQNFNHEPNPRLPNESIQPQCLP